MNPLTLRSLSDVPLASSTRTVQVLSEYASIRGVSQVVPGRARSSDAILVRRFSRVGPVGGFTQRRDPIGAPGCLTCLLALPSTSARTEDTALLKSNRSAVPGAKTEERAVGNHAAARPSSPLRDWPQSDKLSRHDAATVLTGCPSPVANAHWLKFQFTVNQDTIVLPVHNLKPGIPKMGGMAVVFIEEPPHILPLRPHVTRGGKEHMILTKRLWGRLHRRRVLR